MRLVFDSWDVPPKNPEALIGTALHEDFFIVSWLKGSNGSVIALDVITREQIMARLKEAEAQLRAIDEQSI